MGPCAVFILTLLWELIQVIRSLVPLLALVSHRVSAGGTQTTLISFCCLCCCSGHDSPLHGLWAELWPSLPWRSCPAQVGADPAGVVVGVSCQPLLAPSFAHKSL